MHTPGKYYIVYTVHTTNSVFKIQEILDSKTNSISRLGAKKSLYFYI